MKGYKGTILRIDLSSREIRREELSPSLIEHYLGGKGFGNVINAYENPPEVDALSPKNRLILAVGPAAGTQIPTSVKAGLYTRAPLNNVGLESYMGGSFGHFMKRAGYDVIIIQGKSEKPVYVKIINEEVTFADASSLWGLDIYETEDRLKHNHGERARVLCIGPAGERMVRYACIGHDHNRHFGRMGAGAVMGSKNLKAILLIGEGRVDVYNPEGLKSYVRELNHRIREHPGTGFVYPTAGTVNFVAKANDLGVFPSHYWHRGVAKYRDKIDFDCISSNTLVKQTRCFGCTIGCAHINRIKDGPYAGIEIDGPEYETIYVFGGLCDVKDIRDIIKLNDLCDRLGVDTMHVGNILGLLMDATEQHRLTEQFQIAFSDTEAMLSFIEKIVSRRDNWFMLGEGIREVAQHFMLEDLAIHVKGLEPAGYDPRGLYSMAVTYGVSNRGATHLSSNAYARDISGNARDQEVSGEDKSVDRFSFEKKAELVFNMINFNAIADCFILCRFLNRDLLSWEDYAELLYLLTGKSKNKEEFVEIANNIVSLGRWYNIRAGLSFGDDFLPERFYSEKTGEDFGAIPKEKYEAEIRHYYALRNWSEEGIPKFDPPGVL